MTTQLCETTQINTRLLKCALEVDDSREYWRHTDDGLQITARQAFDDYWFGARSLSWVEVLLNNFRARFDAFPEGLSVLQRWPNMDPDTRKLICHWHLQLSDPLYRNFTGDYLVKRREGDRNQVTRDVVVAWVRDQGPGHWTMSTLIQFARRMLSAAHSAGIVLGKRGTRTITIPRVSDDALGYLMYLLRGVDFEGTLLDNPYLASVGLSGTFIEERLATLPGMSFQRQGDLLDFGWRHNTLGEWADAVVMQGQAAQAGGTQ